ncbi:MAG: DUF7662 domain-containing protein [Steroidobacteraceae bacterium]
MSKYAPLRDYLMRQKYREFELTFKEIEAIIGGRLPSTADRPQWWANVSDPATTHVQREAWRSAGYDAFLLRGSDKIKFRKTH